MDTYEVIVLRGFLLGPGRSATVGQKLKVPDEMSNNDALAALHSQRVRMSDGAKLPENPPIAAQIGLKTQDPPITNRDPAPAEVAAPSKPAAGRERVKTR